MPWGGELVAQVMTLWVVAFYLLGCFVVPIALDLLDLERDDLSSRGQASLPDLLDLCSMRTPPCARSQPKPRGGPHTG